ncbi:MAG: thioredoxin-like domain-containing protein, partial [Planctomycetaceae bacterium]
MAHAADPPSAKLALSFKPIQKDIEYETPDAAEFDNCQVKVERTEGASGWVVYGPAGQVLRRFVDTNGDNVVDQWRYYNHGLEVYRDIDGNFNNKVDQSRWLATAGTRWGIDRNEDGRLDEWKFLSAEEASREAVQAIIAQDAAALQAVLINAEDIQSLGIEEEVGQKLLESVQSPRDAVREALSGSQSITARSRWLKFDATLPSLIPAGSGKATQDLLVYAGAMAIIETEGKTAFLQLGEMVRVGDVWKLTQIPQPLEGNVQVAEAGVLLQPTFSSQVNAAVGGTAVTPEMQKLLEDLQKLDAEPPSSRSTPRSVAQYHAERAGLLEDLAKAAPAGPDRNQWVRQLIDGLAHSVQTGAYPQGLARLESLESEIRREAPNSAELPYVVYRRMLSENSIKLQKADNEERLKLQQQFLQDLQGFVTSYPDSADAADAMLQLAISQEFNGKIDDAKTWYTKLVREHADSDAAGRARGAVRRLDLEGQPLVLTGRGLNGSTIDTRQYRGKVLLVIYWATWCRPCTEDLPQIRELYRNHQKDGFEIVGVNLDNTTEPVPEFLRQHSVPWAHIHEPGSLDSPPAKEFGIISLPTMFLVD